MTNNHVIDHSRKSSDKVSDKSDENHPMANCSCINHTPLGFAWVLKMFHEPKDFLDDNNKVDTFAFLRLSQP